MKSQGRVCVIGPDDARRVAMRQALVALGFTETIGSSRRDVIKASNVCVFLRDDTKDDRDIDYAFELEMKSKNRATLVVTKMPFIMTNGGSPLRKDSHVIENLRGWRA